MPGPREATLELDKKGSFGYYILAGTWMGSDTLYNGIGWYRRKALVPEEWKGKLIFLELGRVTDYDSTYFNGEVVGITDYGSNQQDWFKAPRRYRIPDSLVHFGEQNTIAVEVFNPRGEGGIFGPTVRLTAEEPLDQK